MNFGDPPLATVTRLLSRLSGPRPAVLFGASASAMRTSAMRTSAIRTNVGMRTRTLPVVRSPELGRGVDDPADLRTDQEKDLVVSTNHRVTRRVGEDVRKLVAKIDAVLVSRHGHTEQRDRDGLKALKREVALMPQHALDFTTLRTLWLKSTKREIKRTYQIYHGRVHFVTLGITLLATDYDFLNQCDQHGIVEELGAQEVIQR
mmetsp:Transcript_17975/g.47195  ORF Transcript_17975/g.47195 Transcript_17975/m.47195 type:complete len:204 (-) Transcript_17975:2971-3582(-)